MSSALQGPAPNGNGGNNGDNGSKGGGNRGGRNFERCPRCHNFWHGDSACWPRCQQCNRVHRPTGRCPQAAASSGGRGRDRGRARDAAGSSGSAGNFPPQLIRGQHIHVYNTPGIGGMGGMGGMGGTGRRAGGGTAVASAGRGQGPAGNNNRVGKQHHAPGRNQRIRQTLAEEIFQRLVAGGFVRTDAVGNLLPINAPAAPGAIITGTGNNVGGGDANTGANNPGSGATGGNPPSGAVAGSGGNNPASGVAADAGSSIQASGGMRSDVEAAGSNFNESATPVHHDSNELEEDFIPFLSDEEESLGSSPDR